MSDTPTEPSEIIPPYLSSDWQSIRIRLHAAAAHCSAGASESTSEAVRLQVNLAFAELRDVLFALSMMERTAPTPSTEDGASGSISPSSTHPERNTP